MALRKSSVLLPQVFQTDKNKKFLNATVDQFITEPSQTRLNGFIGRKFASNYVAGDNYITEISDDRENYQLEPAVVYRNQRNEVLSVSPYVDVLNSIRYHNGEIENQNDLFSQEYYNWTGFTDIDKLVNYGEYFWLPNGPDTVQIFSNTVDSERSYLVNRTSSGYYFDSSSDTLLPTLYLARGGSYQFTINQPSKFWIQTQIGTSGVSNLQGNLSTREIVGVENNGIESGTLIFNVPKADAQVFFTNMNTVSEVDFATDLTYSQVNRAVVSVLLEQYGGLDGPTVLDGKTLVFANTSQVESDWNVGDLYDGYPYDSADFPGEPGSWDPTIGLNFSQRYNVFTISIETINSVDVIKLTPSTNIPIANKVKIKQGIKYGNRELYKKADGFLEVVPVITADLDVLYYQDGSDANSFGRIELVELDERPVINIEQEILGKKEFISPNGVEFINGLKVQFNSDVIPSMYGTGDWYVEGVGTGITLISTDFLRTPELYNVNLTEGFDTTLFDSGNFDGTLNAPMEQNYITIGRAALDGNAWTRNNRWFHRNVIERTNQYNNFIATIDDAQRAKRPIIEFIPGLKLYNHGIEAVRPVDIIDVEQTDALSNVKGQLGYYLDGISLSDGHRVIFAADPDIRQNIYEVHLVDTNLNNQTQIHLELVDTVQENISALAKIGVKNQGKMFWYDGNSWNSAQQKTTKHQTPLFDVFDSNGNSFSDNSVYPGSTFSGSKLFGFKETTRGRKDPILGIELSYRNFNNIGDIEFSNYFANDLFNYTKSDGLANIIVKSGVVHRYTGLTDYNKLNGWTKVIDQSRQLHVVTFDVDEERFSFSITGEFIDTSFSNMLVFVNSLFIPPARYDTVKQNGKTIITFKYELKKRDTVVIKFHALPGASGYYEIPKNLENNATNDDFIDLTLGQIRNHLVAISRNMPEFIGTVPGNSNIGNLDYTKYPGRILQHSAGLVVPGFVLTDQTTNVISSLEYGLNEYSRFKNKFIDNIDKMDIDLTNPVDAVDIIIENMSAGKTDEFPFFYSDMLPYGTRKFRTTYTVDAVDLRRFEFTHRFDLSTISNRGVLVYINEVQLVEGRDYSFDGEDSAINLTDHVQLQINDEISIWEYENTDGSFVPPTPTKLGLWPKFYPEKIQDSTFTQPKTVIIGHDGSKWVGFDDIRDDIILELEKRIYNNIKTQYNKELFDWAEVIPGFWRNGSDYLRLVNIISQKYFGSWALKNRVNYQNNTHFDATNSFTWNYRNTTDKVKNRQLPGFWRGVYQWYYDTDTPHMTPWNMLGLTNKPVWWDTRYGVAPYTSGNKILWEDLRDGKLYHDAVGTEYSILPHHIRPDLLELLPVNEQGELRSPDEFATSGSSSLNSSDAWAYGDNSPVESAWKRSSEWPFVAQILASLIKPAKYLTLMFDTNLYEKNTELDQIVDKNKTYRPSLADLRLHGSLTSTESSIHRVEGYSQFISNWIKFNNMNLQDAETVLKNLQLNLVYKMAGFSDRKFLKAIAESASPASMNENIFIPDEDMQMFTFKSRPLERVVYSGIKIVKVNDGFQISGYDPLNPYFKIIPSVRSPRQQRITVGNRTAVQYLDFESVIVNIPYGSVIKSQQQVFDFFVAYQRYLEYKGIFFTDINDGDAANFITAGKEFLFWDQQGWAKNSVIAFSPAHKALRINRPFTTVDDLSTGPNVRNENGNPIRHVDYRVSRIDNDVVVSVNPAVANLYAAEVNPVQYENILVFNNTTIFNDVIFQPSLGNRQDRLKLIGFKSGEWDGTLQAPGFFHNENKFDLWQPGKDYNRGNFVSYRNTIYTATTSHGGKQVFDFNDWSVADKINTGLLKNWAGKANSFTEFFDFDNVDLETAVECGGARRRSLTTSPCKAGKGQIGFRSRDYLENLGLDNISQVRFYQGMIKEKGTKSVIDKLISADLTNLDQNIDFYEEWGFRVGEYGTLDNTQSIDIILNEPNISNNPTLIELVDTGETSVIEDALSIRPSDIYKRPKNYNKNIFKLRTVLSDSKLDNMTAGYARIDDVDYTVFSESQLSELNQHVNRIGRGTTIWFASIGNEWDIKRVSETSAKITSVSSAINNRLVFNTDINHQLSVGDFVLVKTDRVFGGFFKVQTTPSPTSFAVISSLTDIQQTPLSISLMKLISSRMRQPRDIAAQTPLYNWNVGEKIWIDKNNIGKWEVVEKTNPWDFSMKNSPPGVDGMAQLGKSVSISTQSTIALVGAPQDNSGVGTVTPFIDLGNPFLVENTRIAANDIESDIAEFGFSVASSDLYHVIGAPGSDSNKGYATIYRRTPQGLFDFHQVLYTDTLSSDDRFGSSVSISDDEKTIVVSAPGNNEVYVYNLNIISEDDAISETIVGDGMEDQFELSFTPISIYSINVVDSMGNFFVPEKDYELNGDTLDFYSPPGDGLNIVIRQQDHFSLTTILDVSSSEVGDNFGISVDTDYSGDIIVIGAPHASVTDDQSVVHAFAGKIYVFARIDEQYISNGTSAVYTATNTPINQRVFVNGVEQTLVELVTNIPNTYHISGNTITLVSPPSSGTSVLIRTNHYELLQEIDQTIATQSPSDSEEFGTSVSVDKTGCTVVAGAPGEDEINPNTGSALVFANVGQRYGSIQIDSSTATTVSGDTIFINNREIELTNDIADLVSLVNNSKIPGVTAELSNDTITIQSSTQSPIGKLKIRPGQGGSWGTLGIQNLQLMQKINHPEEHENENFGTSVTFDRSGNGIVISSDRASTYTKATFDDVTFDSNSTQFIDRITSSGAAYVYQYLRAEWEDVGNYGQYQLIQQLVPDNITMFDQFGSSIAYRGNKIIVGGIAATIDSPQGSMFEFNNPRRTNGWNVIRQETPKVDIDIINRIIVYNRKTNSIVHFLDYIDPAKNKLAGPAQAEIDFSTPYDPAVYTVGNRDIKTVNPQAIWEESQIGRVWWDLSTAKYLDYEQGDLEYRQTYWGQLFPGATIDVYEWVESNVLPSRHVESGLEGTPKYPNNEYYSSSMTYDARFDRTITKYYYWVKNKVSIPEVDFRTLSIAAVTNNILDPKAQGIMFVSVIAQNALLLNNLNRVVQDNNIVLSIDYDLTKNDNLLHSEFELVSEGDPESEIPSRIYNKMMDSLAGADMLGNQVPDPLLSDIEKYGIFTRPRQTIFKNRRSALKVMVQYCNEVFRTIPINKQFDTGLITSSELPPSAISGEWDIEIANLVERNYLNTLIMPIGHKVLVRNDESQNGKWVIYLLSATDRWDLIRIQSFDTTKYWRYATWYSPGFDQNTIPQHQIARTGDLQTLTNVSAGTIVKVLSNDEGNVSFFEKLDSGEWAERIIENGTIQLLGDIFDLRLTQSGFDTGIFDFQAFDNVPTVEIRNIFRALKEDIFVNDLKIHFNLLFFRLIEYALHENKTNVDWLFKTSFLRVIHKLRSLDQPPVFRNDNQRFIENFINEVKPYKSNIREYVLKYDRVEPYDRDVTDFDIHSYFDTSLNYFRKPSGEQLGDEILRTQGLNSQWNENYTYHIDSIVIHQAGSGYINNPTVVISPPDLDTGVQATAIIRANGLGEIIAASVINPGSGYITTPTITVLGGGSGAELYVRIANNKVRSVSTELKFDRITYSSDILDWSPNILYNSNDIVAHLDGFSNVQTAYRVLQTFTSGDSFSAEDENGSLVLEILPHAYFESSADRISAYYVPGPGQIGDDLALLQPGTKYPGNIVTGLGADQEPGFDVTGFDNIPFDNIEIDLDGLTVAGSIDTIIKSDFTDLALGLRPEDINISGGDFIDTYNSHAPEELIPGRIFDTLDIRVYTAPSDDFEWDGNSIPIIYRSYIGNGTQQVFSFADQSNKTVDNLFVWIGSNPVLDYTVNYVEKTITLDSPLSNNQLVHIYGFGNTGEQVAHDETFISDGINSSYPIAVDISMVKQLLVLVNGEKDSGVTATSIEGNTIIELSYVPSENSLVHVFVYNQDVVRDAITEITTQEIDLFTGINTYQLDRPVYYHRPYEGNTIVELDGKRLRPANSKYYIADGNTTVFTIPTTAGDSHAVSDGDIRVTVISDSQQDNLTHNANKTVNVHYELAPSDGVNPREVVFYDAPSEDDTVIISIRSGTEYIIGTNTITITNPSLVMSGKKLYVTSFSNHDPLRIQTKVFRGPGSSVVIANEEFDDIGFDSPNGFDATFVSGVSVNKYELDRPSGNLNYLWVTLNGTKLHPGEYTIDSNGLLDLSNQNISQSSIVVVSSFSENIIQPTIGFRMFQSMNDDWEYTRIADEYTTELAADLHPSDTKIYVRDIHKLPYVTPDSSHPGVIFVGGERITYWSVNLEEGYLTQIRRSTAGTWYATMHIAGEWIIDGSLNNKLPDVNTHTHTWYDLGSGDPANGLGLQTATTINANFLKAKFAKVPTGTGFSAYVQPGYVLQGYVI